MAACVSILFYHSPETQPPWGRKQPAGRWEVPELYLRILAAKPPAVSTPPQSQILGFQGCVGKLAGVLSASGVCLPGRRAVLDSSARSGRGGSWGRKGPRPVPGAHQTSPSWPKQYWEPPTVLAVATPYDPVWAHLHWLVNELVTSGRGKVALA